MRPIHSIIKKTTAVFAALLLSMTAAGCGGREQVELPKEASAPAAVESTEASGETETTGTVYTEEIAKTGVAGKLRTPVDFSWKEEISAGEQTVYMEAEQIHVTDAHGAAVARVKINQYDTITDGALLKGFFDNAKYEEFRETLPKSAIYVLTNSYFVIERMSNGRGTQEVPADFPAYEGWIEEEAGYLHTYVGTYRGTEFLMLILRNEMEKLLHVTIVPAHTETLVPGADFFCSACESYLSTDESGAVVYSDTENACQMTETEVEELVNQFLSAVSCGKKLIEKCPSWIDPYGEFSDLNSGKISIPEVQWMKDEEKVVRDGYTYYISGLPTGRYSMGDDLIPDGSTLGDIGFFDNYNIVGIYSGGFLFANFSCYLGQEELLTEDAELLPFDEIKQRVKDVLTEDFDFSMLRQTSVSTVHAQIEPAIYPVKNPSDFNEYEMIPAWRIRLEVSGSVSGEPSFIYLNAIDGDLLEIIYNNRRSEE